MKITIEFDTDNAAFEDDHDAEVKRLLELAFLRVIGAGEGPLRDSNGNTIGEVRFSA